MKVYVIEKGWYSNREVIGVTESEEAAKAIVKAVDYNNDTEYTEFNTNQFTVNTKWRYYVNLDDGTCEYDEWDYDYYKENSHHYNRIYIIYANSPEAAIKVAGEMDAERRYRKEVENAQPRLNF